MDGKEKRWKWGKGRERAISVMGLGKQNNKGVPSYAKQAPLASVPYI
jgi:hypothetical protein